MSALSLCLPAVCAEAIPDQLCLSKTNANGEAMKPRYAVQSVMDWPDPLGSFAMSF